MKFKKGQGVKHLKNGQYGKVVKIDENDADGLFYQVECRNLRGKVWAKEEWLEGVNNG